MQDYLFMESHNIEPFTQDRIMLQFEKYSRHQFLLKLTKTVNLYSIKYIRSIAN